MLEKEKIWAIGPSPNNQWLWVIKSNLWSKSIWIVWRNLWIRTTYVLKSILWSKVIGKSGFGLLIGKDLLFQTLIDYSDLPNWWPETSSSTQIFGRIWVQNLVTRSNRVEFRLDPKPIRTNPWTTPGTRIAKKHEKWYNKKITLVKSRKQEKWCWSR